jgi:hypothetical protein
MNDEELHESLAEIKQRLARLEQYLGLVEAPSSTSFNVARFQRALMRYMAWLYVLLFGPMLLMCLLMLLLQGQPAPFFLDLPLWNTGEGPQWLFLPIGWLVVGGGGIGLISLGGLSIGGLAWGGGAIGIVAIGGGAFGLIAIGGGAFGLIAIGGGACGYIAIGGGAFGKYVLAGDGKGKYVFDRKRQDEEAVRFFCRFLPRLWEAFPDQESHPPEIVGGA